MSKKKKVKAEKLIDEILKEAIIEEEMIDEGSATEDIDIDPVILELARLQKELDVATDEAAANKDGMLRAQAEFVNFRKRKEREQIQTFQNATIRVVKQFLPVLDDLDRALTNSPENGESTTEWITGIELIYKKLIIALENEGVKVMETKDQQFDPNFHEAIAQEDSPEHESGQITEELQKGYSIGERVLRPALVKVAS
jgi:molecular chaperone GrpE